MYAETLTQKSLYRFINVFYPWTDPCLILLNDWYCTSCKIPIKIVAIYLVRALKRTSLSHLIPYISHSQWSWISTILHCQHLPSANRPISSVLLHIKGHVMSTHTSGLQFSQFRAIRVPFVGDMFCSRSPLLSPEEHRSHFHLFRISKKGVF